MFRLIRYLLAIGSIALAILVVYLGITGHPKPVWPLYVLPPAFILNAIILIKDGTPAGGRFGRLVRLWLDVKEADLRERLARTKLSKQDNSQRPQS